MAIYLAFLRAINLGARRRFAKADIIAATQAAGGSDVATYLTSGNVRLASTRSDSHAVAADLESAYATRAGFDVPTVVFTPAELRAVLAAADDLIAAHGRQPAQVLLTLYAAPPPEAAVAQVEALRLPDQVAVRGRAAVALLERDIHTSPLLRHRAFTALGEGTARNLRVLREIDSRWGG